MNFPSLCIPRVFPNIDENRIHNIFDELNIGTIERIDIVNKQTEKGQKYNRVFIHFKHWYNNRDANQVRERLQNGKEIKIVYDDPWFWKISAYRKPSVAEYSTKKPHIALECEDTNKQSITSFRPRPLTLNKRIPHSPYSPPRKSILKTTDNKQASIPLKIEETKDEEQITEDN